MILTIYPDPGSVKLNQSTTFAPEDVLGTHTGAALQLQYEVVGTESHRHDDSLAEWRSMLPCRVSLLKRQAAPWLMRKVNIMTEPACRHARSVTVTLRPVDPLNCRAQSDPSTLYATEI